MWGVPKDTFIMKRRRRKKRRKLRVIMQKWKVSEAWVILRVLLDNNS